MWSVIILVISYVYLFIYLFIIYSLIYLSYSLYQWPDNTFCYKIMQTLTSRRCFTQNTFRNFLLWSLHYNEPSTGIFMVMAVFSIPSLHHNDLQTPQMLRIRYVLQYNTYMCIYSYCSKFQTGQLFYIYHLWPLLLTWINFNPSMDK